MIILVIKANILLLDFFRLLLFLCNRDLVARLLKFRDKESGGTAALRKKFNDLSIMWAIMLYAAAFLLGSLTRAVSASPAGIPSEIFKAIIVFCLAMSTFYTYLDIDFAGSKRKVTQTVKYSLWVDVAAVDSWTRLNIFGSLVSKPQRFVQSFVGAVLDGSAGSYLPSFIDTLGRQSLSIGCLVKDIINSRSAGTFGYICDRRFAIANQCFQPELFPSYSSSRFGSTSSGRPGMAFSISC